MYERIRRVASANLIDWQLKSEMNSDDKQDMGGTLIRDEMFRETKFTKKKLTRADGFENFNAHTETKVKMRTKTLLLTAAVSAVGLSSSMAQQVFSVNAVGFVNVSIPKGLSLVANPLKAASNTVKDLFAVSPDGTTVYKYDGVSFSINTLDLGAWGDEAQTLLPGEGAFVRNIAAAPIAITFVGEVMQGSLSNPIDGPGKLSIKSSQVPQAGKLVTDLQFPAVDGDTVYQYNNAAGQYDIHALDLGEWSGGEPVIALGEAFFVRKADKSDWKRTFSVN